MPARALQLVPGDGKVGGALVGRSARRGGVAFTGSTEVARVHQPHAGRRRTAPIVPLIAETGGINADDRRCHRACRSRSPTMW